MLRSAVAVYRLNTQRIVDQFLDGSISYEQCISALNSASADFDSQLLGERRPIAINILMSVNSEIVARELQRRKSFDPTRYPRRSV